MKKIITLFLALLLVFSLTACGADTEPEGTEPSTAEQPTTVQPTTVQPTETEEATEAPSVTEDSASPAQTLFAQFKDMMNGGEDLTAEEMANQLISNEIIPFAPMVMAVEPGYLNGFGEEITGFAEGATFGPMIGTIPFVGYVFRLDADADVDAFVQTLKDQAMLNWNICTQADEMLCDAVDHTVFFVMSPASFVG